MRKRTGLATLVALLVITGGCADDVIVGVDPGSGGSGSSTAATSGGTGSGSEPGLVTVRTPGGTSYSIDSTEVSQSQYALFLATSPTPDPTSATCGWKSTFLPGSDPADQNDGPGDPMACQATSTHYDPTSTGDDPVVCVDWCDAAAYCVWAGKRLCGRVGGGSASGADFSDANTGQWYNACSNGGTTPFPYGATYVAGACNDGTTVAPVGGTPGCHGTTAPASGIFDMSGNVGEWEDSCQVNPFDQDGGVPDAQCCAVRGGTFSPYGLPPGGPGSVPAGSTLICGSAYDGMSFGFTCGARNEHNATIGFRCCAD